MSAPSTDPWAWVAKAEEDLAVSRRVLPDLVAPASFHIQQAIEKLLEAIIVSEGKRPPHIHSLLPLRDQIGSALEWSPGEDWLERVSPWAADPRYPSGAEVWGETGLAEALEALQEAERLLAEVKSRLA